MRPSRVNNFFLISAASRFESRLGHTIQSISSVKAGNSEFCVGFWKPTRDLRIQRRILKISVGFRKPTQVSDFVPFARCEACSSCGPNRSMFEALKRCTPRALMLDAWTEWRENRLDMKGVVLLVLSILLTCICVDAQDYAHLELGPIIGLTPAADGNRSLTTDLGGRVVANFSGRSALDFQLTVHLFR